MTDLRNQQCNSSPEVCMKLSAQDTGTLLREINPDWMLDGIEFTIQRKFEFNNYYQTMAFANSVAWIAHQQNHHPDMTITYRHCLILYTTHSIAGLSINDFICAARIDDLIQPV